MKNKFNVDQTRRDIEVIKLKFPDLVEDEVLRADMLEGATDMHEVLDALLAKARGNEALIVGLEHLMDDMVRRRARLNHRVDALRELMLSVLQTANLKKVELPAATLSQRHGQPQLVGAADMETLPDELCRIKREPDRSKIRAALLRGDVVPGVTLSNAPPILTISTK